MHAKRLRFVRFPGHFTCETLAFRNFFSHFACEALAYRKVFDHFAGKALAVRKVFCHIACETLAFRRVFGAISHAKRLRFVRFFGDFEYAETRIPSKNRKNPRKSHWTNGTKSRKSRNPEIQNPGTWLEVFLS